MPHEFRMPSLGADMEGGTLTEWCVQPGATVHRGQVIALVETTKGVIDIESFEDAVVEKLLISPGEYVAVGGPLALLSGADVPARRISPAARALAARLQVDTAQLKGSGPDGAIGMADVQAAGSRPSPRAGIRLAIGAALGRSKREIPHYYLQHSVDFTPAADWLGAWNAVRPVPERLLPIVLMMRAVARSAAEKPGFNGYFERDGFVASAAVHLGVAVSLRGGGLVAPAILDAAPKTLVQLMSDLQQMVTRVRNGHMRSSELSAGTITLTSLGEEGVESLLPIIYPPQVAIVGFGAPTLRPWVVDGQLAVRSVMRLSLAADHRVTDGRQGSQFLLRIAELLSKPGEL